MAAHGTDALRTRLVDLRRRLQDLLGTAGGAPAAPLPEPGGLPPEPGEPLALEGGPGGEAAPPPEAAPPAPTPPPPVDDAADPRGREIRDRSDRARRGIAQEHARLRARVERAFANASARVGKKALLESLRLADEKRGAAEKAQAEVKQRHDRLAARAAEILAAIEGLRDAARLARDGVALLASDLRVRLKETVPPPPPAESSAPEPILDALRARLAETEALLASRLGEGAIRFARISPRGLLLGGLAVLAHAGALLVVRELAPGRMDTALMLSAATLPASLALIRLFRSWMNGVARRAIDPLHESVSQTQGLLQHLEAAWRSRERQIENAAVREQRKRAEEVEARYRGLDEQAKRTAEIRRGILEEQRDHLMELADRRRDLATALEDGRVERDRRALRARMEEEARRRRATEAEAAADRARADRDRLAADWRRTIAEFDRASDEARRAGDDRCPPWGDPRWQRPALPRTFPDGLRLGDARFDLAAVAGAAEGALPPPCQEPAAVSVPLDLVFPAQGHLVLSAEPETRETSLQALFSVALRALCAFPAGKARFTLFDPVGLGQSFAALMHLADYDEALVGNRIWTETSHFERKLAELTEHIEKVIQKYLRNRYRTIGEYNRDVGAMAEACRFLVIADFPTGFSDLAMERLAAVLTSGPRCGVHALILRDKRQKLPAPLAAAGLRGRGPCLALPAVPGGFAVEEETFPRGLLAIEPPPPPEALTALLHAVGRQCADAERVELAFETVAPTEGRLWSESAETGIRVPLGRASADRLQHLELGRGTAQHALVAGKTGSGKSTLFHVLVTSAALWYAPGEVELYLIDFKKGVEFKTYAAHALPHARVVAIESDREFGLSVLRRVDRELTDRAERYRAAGVQEFAAFRRAPGAARIPRTLLLIDEFQEFFTEEDAIGQEAALLLDRIVRQGRAFGVHVVLGSQTLGGSYTLARTTLGQMAVRIALQCNEADSYLILNDDNAAARLLSRPGEAIYNDMAGMVEGNNPFQVAWLPDEVRERLLDRVRERSARDGVTPPEPTTVFEGNVPADLRNNLALRERLARPAAAGDTPAPVAWIGEANAIKGPTEVPFRAQGGSNLLIVGQQREAALSVASSAFVSLAAAFPPDRVRFVLLDGNPPELGQGRHFDALEKALPHRLERPAYAEVPRVMEELAAEVRGRLEGARTGGPLVLLVVHDLQRFRMLRQGSEFDFGGGGGEEKPTADRCFADVLGEGPVQGVHTVVWADSLTSLNRTLNRKTLKEFAMRILFQMSAADSSELIDTPMAGTLGLYRGLLYLEDQGTTEKFRPYALPDADTLEQLRKGLLTAHGR
jgi:hypothetical protein